jgi:hypothetical protein
VAGPFQQTIRLTVLIVFLLFPFLFYISVPEALPPTQAAVADEGAFPKSVRQGETVRVEVHNPSEAMRQATVHFGGKTYRLFPQETGSLLALVPIPATWQPGTGDVNITGPYGNVLLSFPVEVIDAGFPRQNIRVSKQMQSLTAMPGEMKAIQTLKDTATATRFWQEPFLTPTPDCMNSIFGVMRYHNGKPTGGYHKGVDLRSPEGRPVRATASGKVQLARKFRLHGGTVGLDHGQGVTSVYIHLSRLNVKEGDNVEQGDIIGLVGATGFATGPHLHWGLYVNGESVNPGQWMPQVPHCQ